MHIQNVQGNGARVNLACSWASTVDTYSVTLARNRKRLMSLLSDPMLSLSWLFFQFVIIEECDHFLDYMPGLSKYLLSVEMTALGLYCILCTVFLHSVYSFPLAFVYRYFSISRLRSPNPISTRIFFRILISMVILEFSL